MPATTAAPCDTTSDAFMQDHTRSFPKMPTMLSRMHGMLALPPTRITWVMSSFFCSAFSRLSSMHCMQAANSAWFAFSSICRVTVKWNSWPISFSRSMS